MFLALDEYHIQFTCFDTVNSSKAILPDRTIERVCLVFCNSDVVFKVSLFSQKS